MCTLRKEKWPSMLATLSALRPSLRKSSSSGMFFLASSTNHMKAKSGNSQWTILTNTFILQIRISVRYKQAYTFTVISCQCVTFYESITQAQQYLDKYPISIMLVLHHHDGFEIKSTWLSQYSSEKLIQCKIMHG